MLIENFMAKAFKDNKKILRDLINLNSSIKSIKMPKGVH